MNAASAGEISFADAQRRLLEVRALLGSVIVGQEALVTDLVTAVFAGGHVLLEGLPGLGKTHLAKALAAASGCSSRACSARPTSCRPTSRARRSTRPRPAGRRASCSGPGLCSRSCCWWTKSIARPRARRPRCSRPCRRCRSRTPAPATACRRPSACSRRRTRSSSRHLPAPRGAARPVHVQAQGALPRPRLAARLLDVSLDREPADTLAAIAGPEDVLAIAQVCRSTLLAERCKQAAVSLVLATQPDGGDAASAARQHLRYGASPRALQSLVRAARVRAVMDGRSHVDVADLEAVARSVLRHRVLLRLESELDGSTGRGARVGARRMAPPELNRPALPGQAELQSFARAARTCWPSERCARPACAP